MLPENQVNPSGVIKKCASWIFVTGTKITFLQKIKNSVVVKKLYKELSKENW